MLPLLQNSSRPKVDSVIFAHFVVAVVCLQSLKAVAPLERAYRVVKILKTYIHILDLDTYLDRDT